MPRISVIMPVYNVEPFLRDCLDSVRAQTMTDWECICVDDGSIDESAAVLDGYALRDSRFRVFRREHSNAGAVRNFGMKEATGDFLCFLDSDDVFSPWMFETLLGKADESNADVVAGSFLYFSDGMPSPSFARPEHIEWSDRTPDPDWSRRPLSAGTMPWNKIIRRRFVRENVITFLEQKTTNDLTFMATALALSRKTFHTETPLVAYRQRTKSLQAAKSRNPRNCLRAHRAFREGLVSRGVWDGLSEAGRSVWFLFYAGSVVWELSSQTTTRGYLSLYKGILETDRSYAVSKSVPEYAGKEWDSIVRYRSIVRGGVGERLRALKEAILCPLNANRKRATGVRAAMIRATDWLAIRYYKNFTTGEKP